MLDICVLFYNELDQTLFFWFVSLNNSKIEKNVRQFLEMFNWKNFELYQITVHAF